MSVKAKTIDPAKNRGKGRKKQGKIMFLMILPFLILNFLFAYFPLYGWYTLFMITKRRCSYPSANLWDGNGLHCYFRTKPKCSNWAR